MTEVFQISLNDLAFLEADWKIGGIADPVGQIANYIVSSLESAFSSAIGSFQTVVSSTINAAISGVNSLLNSVSSHISQVLLTVQGLPSVISSSLSGITSQISSILNGAVSSISSNITQISYAVSSGFNSILSSLNSSFSALSNSLNATIKNITTQISSSLNPIVSSISSIVSQIGGSLSSIGSSILGSLNNAFSQLSSSFNGIINQVSGFVGQISSSINSALSSIGQELSAVGAQILVGLQAAFNTFTTQLSGLASAIITPIQSAINTLLTDFFNSAGFKGIISSVFALPSEISDFFKSATNVLDKLTEQHSPSILDDFEAVLQNIITLFSSSGLFGSLLQSEGLKSFMSGKGILQTVKTDTDFFKPLTDFLTTIWTTIQQDVKPFTDAISSAFGVLVSAAISDFGLPAPAAGITDPFEMIGSTVTQEFDNLAAMVTPKNFITDDNATKTLETILAVIGLTEGLEFGALAIEALHPTKKLQFMDKLKGSFSKIGLGHVTGIVGASLVAVSLSPFFRRYFNKVAQVQLVDPSSLMTMFHREVLNKNDLDEYLQEHGYNPTFRDALIEIGYDLPSRFILRSMWMVGALVQSDLETIFTQSGMLPKYVKQAASATLLQGQLPYLKAQETAFASQVTKGFETGATLTDMLKKIGYPQTFIDPTVAAANLKADEELNVLQVSEYDKQYTEGYMLRADYVKNITPLFKNTDILNVHIQIADLAVQRMTDSRIRTASDRSISEELTAFANGAISEYEFATICKAAKKTPEEIAALEEARQIIYTNLVRTVKFRNYQGALGKGNITPAQFETLCNALPIDAVIMKATEQHIILGMVKAAKITTATANTLLANAGIPLTTS